MNGATARGAAQPARTLLPHHTASPAAVLLLPRSLLLPVPLLLVPGNHNNDSPEPSAESLNHLNHHTAAHTGPHELQKPANMPTTNQQIISSSCCILLPLGCCCCCCCSNSHLRRPAEGCCCCYCCCRPAGAASTQPLLLLLPPVLPVLLGKLQTHPGALQHRLCGAGIATQDKVPIMNEMTQQMSHRAGKLEWSH
jgi:hypothetical protein